VSRGISESLEGAEGCDREFHALFEQFRRTRAVNTLVPPECSCRPLWLE
jgi:hypothetical protein